MPPRETRTRYLLGNRFLDLAVAEWGDPAAPPVVCVHGLTRNGRDFDFLAADLARDHYVLCPDLPGRGGSDWLPDPALYAPATYVAALAHLLAPLGKQVDWVGTSLGGICGMVIAAAAGSPIRRLVLNDIGPHIPAAALARIRDYVGAVTDFPHLRALELHLRVVHAPFGQLDDDTWGHLARHSARTLPNGRIAPHYDPAIAEPLRASEPRDADLWPVWSAIRAPTLVIRGATSDLLLQDTLERMAARAQTHTVADAGHAPALADPTSIAVIRGFLDG